MSAFIPQRITKEIELTIEADPRQIFPLLCPVREYEWIEPWQCRVLYSESGVAENNCVFETDFPHAGGRETWVVSHYDKDRAIEFVRFTPDEKIIKLDIRLSSAEAGCTRMRWRRVYTALSPKGNRTIVAMADDFEPEAQRIAQMLNHYLNTGTMLPLAKTHAHHQ
jgi:hypothetical protein